MSGSVMSIDELAMAKENSDANSSNTQAILDHSASVKDVGVGTEIQRR